MRVLVCGAGGFIGSAVVEQLAKEGHRVHRVVRSTPEEGEAQINLTTRRLDVSRLPGATIEGIDAVINLAGEALTVRRWGRAKRKLIVQSRVVTTEVLARSMAEVDRPPDVFVAMSASGYYGSRGDEVLVEGSTAGSDFLAECCRSWEAAAAPARERGIRVVNMRSGIVLGSGGALAKQIPLFRAGLGGRLGSGRQWTSWISLNDAVRALLHALEDGDLLGPCNLCSPEAVRNDDFTAELASAVHRPAGLAVPRAALLALFGRVVTDEFLLASQRMRPERLLASGFSFEQPTLRDAILAVLEQR